jgi:GxxExxY protein
MKRNFMKSENNYKYSDLTEKIIKEAYHVFNYLGSGFMEKVYENALTIRLKKADLNIETQFPINVYFENELIGEYIADIVVENKIIVELKAVKRLNSIHEVQIVNYLKATNMEVGLLLNFGEKLEIKRKVNSNPPIILDHSIHKRSASKKTDAE